MKILSGDCETALIRPALLAPPLTCSSFAWRDGDAIQTALEDHVVSVESWRTALAAPDTHLVGANIVYDLGVIASEDYTLIDPIFAALDAGKISDVQSRQKLIDNARGHLGGYWVHDHEKDKPKKIEYKYSLASLVLRHLGKNRFAQKDDPDGWRMRFGELRGVPVQAYPPDAAKYAVEDAVDTLLVYEAQEVDREFLRDVAHQQRAHFALHLCSCWGVKTSPDAIRRLELTAVQHFEDLTERLIKAGLVRPQRKTKTGKVYSETRDTKAAQKRMVAVMEALGEPVKLTPKGGVCLDEEACRESLDDLLIDYAERTSLTTIVTSHIPALWLGTETPIQASYEPILETGRTSCRFREDGRAKKTPTNGYQLQNVRRLPGIRECFVAREGKTFFDYDFEQLELRTVGQVLMKIVGWSKLAEALNAGQDVHLLLGAQILGIDYDTAKARKKEPEVAEARQLAKVAGFGYPGGLGPPGFRAFASGYGVKVTLDQARQLKEFWFAAFPEYREYFDWVASGTGDGNATIEQLFTNRLRGGCRYTQVANGMFQALGADCAKAALYAVSKACYAQPDSPLFGARPWGFIHDQVIGECDEEVGHEVAFECRDVMLKAANVWLPDVPLPLGEPVLSRVWSKNASQVWLDSRLIPWTEEIGAVRKARVQIKIAQREGKKPDEAALEIAYEKLDAQSRRAMDDEVEY